MNVARVIVVQLLFAGTLSAQGLQPVPGFESMPRFERSLWGTVIPTALGGAVALTSPRDRTVGGAVAVLGVVAGPVLGYIGEHDREFVRGWAGAMLRGAAIIATAAPCKSNCGRNGLVIAGEGVVVASAVIDIVRLRHRGPAGPARGLAPPSP